MDNNQRGEGREKTGEKKGKGHEETCIKDTWTKPKRGRIEGGWWGWVGRGQWLGENGDNCT